MLLRIPKTALQLGMYVETVECPFSEFDDRRFLMKDPAVLRLILRSSADTAVVNTAKSSISCVSLIQRFQSSKPTVEQGHKTSAHVRISKFVGQTTKVLSDGLLAIKDGKFETSKLAPIVANIASGFGGPPDVLLEVTRLKSQDEATYIHSIVVSCLMARLSDALAQGDKVRDQLTLAGLLHDIGKLLIAPEILAKPDHLTDTERAKIRQHPELGYQLLRRRTGVPDLVLDVCRHHHEAIDGSGYPSGIRGEAICLNVRICTVCDVFEALTSVRPYKSAWTSKDALRWMFERDHLFDRKLVLKLGSIIL